MALLPLALSVQQHATGVFLCLESRHGSSEWSGRTYVLLGRPSTSTICWHCLYTVRWRRGATICPVTANLYIHNVSSICIEPSFALLDQYTLQEPLHRSATWNSLSQSYQRYPPARTAWDVYLGLGKSYPPTSARISLLL